MAKTVANNEKLGLFQSSVINMIEMVGIGPFIVLPIVINKMGGPYFFYAWLAGAFLSFVDSMVWSELGSAFPKAGGTFNFLREGFGTSSWGLLLSFLFVWQTLFQAPMVLASGSIGFAEYFNHLLPLTHFQTKLVAAGVILLITLLLYRKIKSIGKIGTFLWITTVLTLGLIIFGGIWKGDFARPIHEVNHNLSINIAFFVALGAASVKTMYSFGGYYNICYIGGDVKNPARNIPRSMFIAIFTIAILYLLMNVSVTSVIPWQEAQFDDSVISTFAGKVYGATGGIVVTILILSVALASLFAVLLGYSRVPYAAAKNGDFLPIFAKEHPTKKIPYVSLFFLAGMGLVFSLVFNLEQAISGILAMRILVQFIGQGVGVILLRKKTKGRHLKYRMPLYPIPVIMAIGMWLAIFISTGLRFMLAGIGMMLLGAVVYFAQAYFNKKWPFKIVSA